MTRWWLVPALLALSSPILSSPAWAGRPDQRYHAILIDHDNASYTQLAGGSRQYVWPAASPRKGFDLVLEEGYAEVQADPDKPPVNPSRSGLAYTGRDSRRFEQLLLRYGHPGLVERATHEHDSDDPLPANELRGTLRANRLADVGAAFQATACRLAALDPEHREVDPAYDCTGSAVPEGAAAEGAGRVEDVVFVYFSGHGLPGGLVLADGLLDAETLELLVGSLPADLVVVVIDACYGGAYSADGSSDHHPVESLRAGLLGGPRRVAVFNSASVVPEVDPLQSGFLTHIVLSGLMGVADDDRDGRIRYEELAAFFALNTAMAGELAGRTAAPRGNRRRVLFDHGMAVGATQVLTVDRGLGGRLLVAEDEGAVAEANVTRPIWGKSARVDLHLPIEEGRPIVDLYFLPIRDRPRDQRLTEWSDEYHLLRMPTQLDRFTGVPAAADAPLASYLEDSQGERRGFAHQSERIGLMGLGNRASLSLTGGYVRTEAYGRLKERVEDPDDPLPSSHEDLAADLAAQEAQSWNLAQVGLVGRAHFLGVLLAEGRGELWASPQAKVMGSQSALFMARVGGGGGVSGYLGTRALAGSLSGGATLMTISASELGGTGLDATGGGTPVAVYDPLHTGWYAAAGAKLALPRIPPLDLELAWLHDAVGYRRTDVGVVDGGSGYHGATGTIDRTDRYAGLRVTVGMTLGVLPR